MRGTHRESLTEWIWAIAIIAVLAALALSCSSSAPGDKVPVPGAPAGAVKSSAAVRLERRAYDGAPPVIPHKPFGVPCGDCHNATGLSVKGVGYAPASPHGPTRGMEEPRCEQCHVFRRSNSTFRKSSFVGARRQLRGHRLYVGAPPVMPHPAFMREDCLSCHSGPAAREEIRTTHPERERCRQCHVEAEQISAFTR